MNKLQPKVAHESDRDRFGWEIISSSKRLGLHTRRTPDDRSRIPLHVLPSVFQTITLSSHRCLSPLGRRWMRRDNLAVSTQYIDRHYFPSAGLNPANDFSQSRVWATGQTRCGCSRRVHPEWSCMYAFADCNAPNAAARPQSTWWD